MECVVEGYARHVQMTDVAVVVVLHVAAGSAKVLREALDPARNTELVESALGQEDGPVQG